MPTTNSTTASQTISFPLNDSTDSGTAFVAYPEGEGPHPAVLVLHEIFGLNSDMERVAKRFADNGYIAMAPDYFGPGFRINCIVQCLRSLKSGKGNSFDRLAAAQAWLINQSEVDASRVGVVGFCMGGGFSVLYAAEADVHVVAEYYGDVPKKAEALQGIPPCFGGFGDKDRIFGPKAEKLRSHLDELGVANEIVSYPEAGHSYMSDMPGEGVMGFIGTKGPMDVGYDPTAAEDSWTRMLAFFAEHLASDTSAA